MTRSFLPLLIMCFACLNLQATEHKHNLFILFRSNECIPAPEALHMLDSVLHTLNDASHFDIEIQGHTDNIGSQQYNRELSMKRTQSVRQYISDQLKDTTHIKIKWFGEIYPADNNESEEGRQANRRVAVKITTYQWETAAEMMREISPAPEVFTIEAQKAISIASTSGILFHIPDDAFDGVTANGEKVTVKVISAINKKDWVAHGLSTMSDEGLLESGGMFKLEAFHGADTLKLKTGKVIKVQVPFTKFRDGMLLFKATQDDIGNLVWKRDIERNLAVKGKTVDLPCLKIDTVVLDKIIAGYLTHKFIASDYKYSIPKIPAAPAFRSGMPKKPKEPTREKTAIYISRAQQLLLTSRAKERMKDAAFAKVMNKYRIDSAIFEKRIKKYHSARVKFEQDQILFKQKYGAAWEQLSRAKEMIICKRLTYWESKYYSILAARLKVLREQIMSGNIRQPVNVYNIPTGFRENLRSEYIAMAMRALYHKDLYTVDSLLGFKNNFSTDYKSRNFYNDIIQLEKENKIDTNPLERLFNDANTGLKTEREKMGIRDGMKMDGYYNFDLGDMNWINCDRFNLSAQTAKLIFVQDPNSTTFIVFENTNSLVHCNNGKIRVPANETFSIMSVSIRNGKPWYAVTKVKAIEGEQHIILNYKPGRVPDIKNAIASVSIS
jgi:hypothetical protein